MATAGRVLLMSKGAWASGTSYSPMDYVYYGGNSYVCKSATSGTTTPDNDTTHWQLMASGFDMDMITQTITNEQNKIASDAAVYAETVKLEAQDAALAADIATVETTSTASKAYSVGEYLVYNNQLYRVTASIASGGTLTVGTNISATSAGGELTSIKDALSKLSPVGSYDNFWVSMNAGYQGKGTCTVPIPNFSDNYNVTITDAMSYNGSTGTQIKNKLTATPRSFGFVISSSDTAEVGKSIVIAFTITEKT